MIRGGEPYDMKTVCEEDKCTGCTACVAICPHNAITISDTMKSLNAVINETACINCGACKRICQVNYPIKKAMAPVKWYQGWAEESDIRLSAASGGAATVIEQDFINNGGYVCSCTFVKGKFVYCITNKIEDIKNFKGSKYVKSDSSGVYKEIRLLLKQGNKVLFVGLPCHVAGVKKYVGENLSELLFTVDLICHGSPSQKLLKLFLEQHDKKTDHLNTIEFRRNSDYRLMCNDQLISEPGCMDKYSMGFLKSLFNTDNCYECAYAKKERISDITLGDSWGASFSKEEQKKGISLILCQTEKGQRLIEESKLRLFDVDIDEAIRNNHQLSHPSVKPDKLREKFFAELYKGEKVDKLVRSCYPKSSFKQKVKGMMFKLFRSHEK